MGVRIRSIPICASQAMQRASMEVSIEDLRAHRQCLRKLLGDRPSGGIDADRALKVFEEELRVIEAALASF